MTIIIKNSIIKIVGGDFMERIKREDYLSILRNFKDQQIIKVITGIRRCGKSTLLELFQDYLK